MKKNLLTIVATIITLGFFGFIGYRAYTEAHPILPKEVRRVSVAYQESEINIYTLLDLAEQKGYFRQSGIEIDRKTGLKSISTFLASGQVDAGVASLIPALSDFYSDQDIKLLAVTERFTPSIRFVSRFPQDKLSEVKNVVINRPGGAPQNIFWIVSKNLGIDASKINYVVAADPQAAIALLEKGSVDFVMVSNEEAYQKIRTKEGIYTINSYTAYQGVSMPNGIYSSAKVLSDETKANDLSKLVAAVKKAADYYDNHRAEMIEFLGSKNNLSKEDAESAYDRLKKAREGINYRADLATFENIIQSVKELNKPINPGRDLNEILDSRFK